MPIMGRPSQIVGVQAATWVQRDQKLATDQAPPFASLAKMPDFNANRLASLLLKPHPNMPTLSLSRAEIADIAEYIATLK